jgi:serine protease Do
MTSSKRSVVFLGAMLSVSFALTSTSSTTAQTRLERVLRDKVDINSKGFWIYNDLASGFEAARNSGQPMIITLRCIPCEECVKLDEELIESDEELRKILNQFVRVRVVATNGLDLSLFQYDYDQSFAIFVLNADGTIYARYGTRSDRTEWKDDVSLEGLAETLRAALKLHREYPNNQKSLAGKQSPSPLFEKPESSPLHQGRFPTELVFNDNVVKNCIHCHMIGDAQRDYFRREGKPVPAEILFQYPHPKNLGMIVDPSTRSTIKSVEKGSAAEKAGFRQGDQIESLGGQPILSLADMQWVLHGLKDETSVQAVVTRGDRVLELTLPLATDWRENEDLSWRVSTWPMRAMVAGGLKLTAASNEVRNELNLPTSTMALVVEHVGQYGKHAIAKQAGFQKGDIIVSYDGRSDLVRETDLIAYGMRHTKPNDRVEVKVLRNGKPLEMQLRMQN